MDLNRIRLKERALSQIAAAAQSPIMPTLGYVIIAAALVTVQGKLEQRFAPWYESVKLYVWGAGPVPALYLTNLMLYSALFILLLRLVSDIISVGYSWYALRISRSMEATFSNIFDPLNVIIKLIGLEIVISVLIFLWSLLFIIPGIVAAYSYRQAFYVLFDHPEYGIFDCIRESKRMMRGSKGELFMLDLSFIGWHFVCILTFGILYIWKLPYIEVTYAGFYDAVKGVSGQSNDAPRNEDPWGQP